MRAHTSRGTNFSWTSRSARSTQLPDTLADEPQQPLVSRASWLVVNREMGGTNTRTLTATAVRLVTMCLLERRRRPSPVTVKCLLRQLSLGNGREAG